MKRALYFSSLLLLASCSQGGQGPTLPTSQQAGFDVPKMKETLLKNGITPENVDFFVITIGELKDEKLKEYYLQLAKNNQVTNEAIDKARKVRDARQQQADPKDVLDNIFYRATGNKNNE